MASSDFDLSTIEIPCSIVNGIRSPPIFPVEQFKSAFNYRPYDDDIVLCGYPKSGTTWTQYILCNLLNYDKFTGDFTAVEKMCPSLELDGSENMKPGSLYRIHLPFIAESFNPDAKYVFVMRNPRDLAVSYYHFTTAMPPGVPGLPKGIDWFARFAELFVKGEVCYGNYMDYHRNWLAGLRQYGKPENILIVLYEKMKKDPRAELMRIANFLGGKAADLVKDEKVVETILGRTSVKSMKESVNKSLGSFMKNIGNSKDGADIDFVRKGVVGDHVNHFTPEISEMFDNFIASDPRNQEIMKMFDV